MADTIDPRNDAPARPVEPSEALSAPAAVSGEPLAQLENAISPAPELDLSAPIERAADWATEPEDIAYERAIDEAERIGIAEAEARLRREDETERPLTAEPVLQRGKPVTPEPDRADEAAPAASKDAEPAPANDDGPNRFSVERGDVPDGVKRRYLSEEPQFAPEVRFFTDATGKEAAFRDTGDKLVARQTNAEVIKDLVAIAQHRGWSAIDVRGEETFRRAVWMEARTEGLEVRGYKPTERDLQELDRHLSARDTNSVAPARDRAPQETEAGRTGAAAPEAGAAPKPAQERLDYDKGVSGKLLESGEAPYRHRSGQELTPFVRVELASGRQVEVWGVGLPAALEKSGAAIGDEITLRRDGVERVIRSLEVRDKVSGELSLQQREVPRNKWTIDADRFRSASPAEAAKDPALQAAQSRLAVVSAVVKDRHADPAVQDRLIAGAKDKIAGHLERGGRFEAAKVREAADRSPAAPRSSKAPSPAPPPTPAKTGPERTRGR
jgi:hypothetical protein